MGANNLELVVVVAIVFYLLLLSPTFISVVFTVLLIYVFRMVLLVRWF